MTAASLRALPAPSTTVSAHMFIFVLPHRMDTAIPAYIHVKCVWLMKRERCAPSMNSNSPTRSWLGRRHDMRAATGSPDVKLGEATLQSSHDFLPRSHLPRFTWRPQCH